MRVIHWPLPLLILALAGCATHSVPVVVAVAPPPVEVVPGPPLPPGATPGMLVPQRLADGSFPTPNQGRTGAAAIWHLRAGLNVAALSCPGSEGAAIRAGYNAWLKRAKTPLARAQASYASQYRGQPITSGYDYAMTRLYNFYSQTPVRPAFCTAAAGIVADLTTLTPAGLPAFSEMQLALLDQPFVDFYTAYAAWRDGPAPRTVIATAAVTPPTPFAPMPAATRVPARRPALTLDLSALPEDATVTASN
ncbi:hypothetical protein [Sphingomonas bacterium]|uniref:hypothetical protein n=1 Tax=Sphingomonas bacterium TaxID=1895847 RepID=UPI0020C72E60|nr:hypothetical protein [Sphingomonas bacterium]